MWTQVWRIIVHLPARRRVVDTQRWGRSEQLGSVRDSDGYDWNTIKGGEREALRAPHTTLLRRSKQLQTPKKWFKANWTRRRWTSRSSWFSLDTMVNIWTWCGWQVWCHCLRSGGWVIDVILRTLRGLCKWSQRTRSRTRRHKRTRTGRRAEREMKCVTNVSGGFQLWTQQLWLWKCQLYGWSGLRRRYLRVLSSHFEGGQSNQRWCCQESKGVGNGVTAF